jgi:hypothetical protein
MAAGHDDHVAGFVDGQIGEDFLILRRVHAGGLRKAFAVGERFAVIHHYGGETSQRGDFGKALGNMAGPENIRVRTGPAAIVAEGEFFG